MESGQVYEFPRFEGKYAKFGAYPVILCNDIPREPSINQVYIIHGKSKESYLKDGYIWGFANKSDKTYFCNIPNVQKALKFKCSFTTCPAVKYVDISLTHSISRVYYEKSHQHKADSSLKKKLSIKSQFGKKNENAKNSKTAKSYFDDSDEDDFAFGSLQLSDKTSTPLFNKTKPSKESRADKLDSRSITGKRASDLSKEIVNQSSHGIGVAVSQPASDEALSTKDSTIRQSSSVSRENVVELIDDVAEAELKSKLHLIQIKFLKEKKKELSEKLLSQLKDIQRLRMENSKLEKSYEIGEKEIYQLRERQSQLLEKMTQDNTVGSIVSLDQELSKLETLIDNRKRAQTGPMLSEDITIIQKTLNIYSGRKKQRISELIDDSSQRRAARNLFKEFESIEGENLPIGNRIPTKSAPFLSSPDTLGASSSCLQLEHITEDPCLESLADKNNQASIIINERVSFIENSNSTRKCNITPTRLTKTSSAAKEGCLEVHSSEKEDSNSKKIQEKRLVNYLIDKSCDNRIRDNAYIELEPRFDLETSCHSLTKHATEAIDTVQNRFESNSSDGGTSCDIRNKVNDHNSCEQLNDSITFFNKENPTYGEVVDPVVTDCYDTYSIKTVAFKVSDAFWAECEVLKNAVPHGHNGKAVFELEISHYGKISDIPEINDGRDWRKKKIAIKSFEGCSDHRRFYQDCNGHRICPNIDCTAKQLFGQPSRLCVKKDSKSLILVCSSCNAEMIHMVCKDTSIEDPNGNHPVARRYLDFDMCHNTLTVRYVGTHSCLPLPFVPQMDEEFIKKYFLENPASTVARFKDFVIKKALNDGQDVSSVSLQYADDNKIRQIMMRHKKATNPDGSGFGFLTKFW